MSENKQKRLTEDERREIINNRSLSTLRPQFKVIFDEIKEKRFTIPIVYNAFTSGEINKLNEFEIILLIAAHSLESLEELQKEYETYIKNDTRPIIIQKKDTL